MFSVVFLIFLVSAFFYSFSFLGYATANASFGFQNLAPAWITIPNQSWPQNTQISLYLTNYSSDPENYTLSYGYTFPANMTVSLSGNNLTLIPDSGFVGNRTIIFSAYDYVSLVYSNTVFLTVNSTIVPSSGGGSSGTSTSSTGGGGGTTTIYVNVSEEEEEEQVIYFSPELSFPCKKKTFYLEDISLEGYLENVFSCYTFFFSEKDSKDSAASLYFVLVHTDEELVVADFTDEAGVLNQITLQKEANVSLDVDGDGIDDYLVRLDQLFDDGSARIYVESLSRVSFALFTPLTEKNISFWFLLFFLLFLLSCIFVYLYRRKLFK